jgi:hypothetical protein
MGRWRPLCRPLARGRDGRRIYQATRLSDPPMVRLGGAARHRFRYRAQSVLLPRGESRPTAAATCLASRCRGATASPNLGGMRPATGSSNPSPSSGESSTNLLAASRREFSSRALKPPAYWLSVPLPRRSSAHFSLRKHRHQGLAIRARRRVVDLVRRRIWAGYRDWRRWLLVRPRCCRIGPRRCRAAPACRVAERGASDLMQAMDRSFHAS